MKNLALVTLLFFFIWEEAISQSKILPENFEIFTDHTSGKLIRKSNNLTLESGNYLVVLSPGVRETILSGKGIKLQRKLSGNVFIAWLTHEAFQKTGIDHIANILKANDLWKLSPHLLTQSAQPTEELHTFYIKVDPGSSAEQLFKLHGIDNIATHAQNIFSIKTTIKKAVKDLIHERQIVYIGIESNDAKLESRVLDLNLNPNTINLIHHKFPELNGNNVVLSIQENAFNPEDIDLLGRNINSGLASDIISSHATDMATIAAGAGNSFINGKGVAWSSKVTSSNFEEILPDSDESYQTINAWVQNHSYGTELESFYGAKAMSFDISAHQNPTLLHVFSAGNQGLEISNEGLYRGINGFANLTGNFKMAKNILTVGSVDTTGTMVSFVSRGPAYDGRVKPEIVAYSTAGSSNSAALVSGLAILLQQKYLELEKSLPTSALLKALLINSAKDVENNAVDFLTGYGNVDGFRTIENLISRQYLNGTVSQNESRIFDITVPANISNFKATIVWNDPAAQPNANMALVNDLDLSLEKGGETWLPWVLNTNPDAASLSKPAVRDEDHLNNVEQVTIANPDPGLYQLRIVGFNITQEPQSYSIAYQWDERDKFQWTFPTGSDQMPYNGETGSYFRWKSTLSVTNGQLQYSLNNGQSWITLNDEVDLQRGYFRWKPTNMEGLAKARMVVGTNVYETETFGISNTPKVTIGFNCEDSVLIQWNKVDQATGYDLFISEEGKPFLSAILTTQDTSVIIQKVDFPTRRFAVQPISSNGARYLRSNLIDYDVLGPSCYLQSFFALRESDEGIKLFLDIGTDYQVHEIIFQRKVNENFIVISNITSDIKLNNKYLDKTPLQGLNIHRAVIKLANGKEIISNEVNSYFLTKLPFLVFPNPVWAGQPLNIVSSEFGEQSVVLKVFNQTGQLVLEKTIEAEFATIQNIGLSPGLYYYQLDYSKGKYGGKIVIN